MVAFVALVALLIATVPVYPYSRGWGYRPGGFFMILLLFLLLLVFLQIIPWGYPHTYQGGPAGPPVAP
jgi:hypothetical protein